MVQQHPMVQSHLQKHRGELMPNNKTMASPSPFLQASAKRRMEEEGEVKTTTFGGENYSNRRVFLRSYPLVWQEGENEAKKQEEDEKGMRAFIVSLKQRFVSVLHLKTGRCLLLKKIKNKIAFYLVACNSPGCSSKLRPVSS